MDATEMTQTLQPPPQQYDTIGGWLILLAIGLVLSPMRILLSISQDVMPAFKAETWTVLTTPGTEAYHPLWAPILIFELVGNCAFIILSIIAAVCFFQRRRIAPKLIIIFFLANLVFVGLDFVAADFIPALATQSDTESIKELTRVIITCLIWVPYLLVSKRVKKTFVR